MRWRSRVRGPVLGVIMSQADATAIDPALPEKRNRVQMTLTGVSLYIRMYRAWPKDSAARSTGRRR